MPLPRSTPSLAEGPRGKQISADAVLENEENECAWTMAKLKSESARKLERAKSKIQNNFVGAYLFGLPYRAPR